jgi:hypothetical protein
MLRRVCETGSHNQIVFSYDARHISSWSIFMEPGTKVKDKESIWPVSEIDLHALAEEKGEVDDFLTIYLTVNIRDDRPHIASRLKPWPKRCRMNLKRPFQKPKLWQNPL